MATPFAVALVCCQRHLDISQEQGDKVGEARALYNIGNVYHAKGKQLSWSLTQEPNHLPEEVQESLEKASKFYEKNLSLVKELGNRAAQGREYDNLGNSHYLLGNFRKAIIFHKQRLAIAKEFGDKAAEKRSHSNLGNAHIFLGRFDIFAVALVCCQRHLDISQEQGDKVGEARALYNIGNIYHAKGKQLSWSLTQEPNHVPEEVQESLEKASEFYEKNISLVKELGDRAAPCQAYGNLGNSHYLLGNFRKAIIFHKQRLAIAKEFGDKAAEKRAHSNLGNVHIFLGRFDIAAEYYKKALQRLRQHRLGFLDAWMYYSHILNCDFYFLFNKAKYLFVPRD
nr:G-protein-signaling modulator 1-like [Zootoca vivipara]